MKKLIENQELRIDNHKRNEPNDWDTNSDDVHLHKITQVKFNGKPVTVDLKLPLNSDREPTFKIKNCKENNLKDKLTKEINDALSDITKREKFTEELINILKGYKSQWSDREKAKVAVTRLAKHLDLDENIVSEMTTYIDGKLLSYTALLSDKNKRVYFMTFNEKDIRIGEVNRFSKSEFRFNEFVK